MKEGPPSLTAAQPKATQKKGDQEKHLRLDKNHLGKTEAELSVRDSRINLRVIVEVILIKKDRIPVEKIKAR